MRVMLGRVCVCVCVRAHLSKHTHTKHGTHYTVQGDVYSINGGTHAYYEQIDNDNVPVYNTGNQRCLLMYCRISLNRPTVEARPLCFSLLKST